MDSKCSADNAQPQLHDGTGPSSSSTVSETSRTHRAQPCRASESVAACERRLARDRARRRQRLASETAEERERHLFQRRVRDRARRAALSSPTRETGLEHMRARQQERIASETPEETAAMCAHSNKCSVFIRVSSQSEHYFVAKVQLKSTCFMRLSISWIAPARQKCTAFTY